MSFSADVKDELSRKIPKERERALCEMSAIVMFLGRYTKDGDITVETESITAAKTALVLARTAFDTKAQLEIKRSSSRKGTKYIVALPPGEDTGLCLSKSLDHLNALCDESPEKEDFLYASDVAAPAGEEAAAEDKTPDITKDPMEKARAFLRGAFISSGTMSDPGRSYHFEIDCAKAKQALLTERLFGLLGIAAKRVKRKEKIVVYLKDSELIVNALGALGAYNALLKLENIRIIKDMKNSANRQYNCDFANINKIVRASAKQAEDIRLIIERGKYDDLSPSLKNVAAARLEHPDASLSELGQYLDPPVGKSGVSHRLKKLSDIAQDLRES